VICFNSNHRKIITASQKDLTGSNRLSTFRGFYIRSEMSQVSIQQHTVIKNIHY